MNLVQFDRVSLTISGKRLINQLTFSMEKGEHIGVIGPSGAGKSTFLQLLLGFITPTEGKVFLFGEDLSKVGARKLEALRMNLGMLFQSDALFAEWSVYENIAFPIRYHHNMAEDVLSGLVKMKLDCVGLRGVEEMMPSELSGGMARRVALARAIALDPKFVIYDEPFTGQDPVTKSNLKALMMRLQKKYQVSSLIVSHDIQDLAEIVDKMVVIWDGEIVASGTASAVMETKNKRVRDFILGKSPLEKLEGRALKSSMLEEGDG